MQNIDTVHVHFEQGQLDLLNYCLSFIMFGVALEISLADFRAVFLRPRAPIVGLLLQFLFFPLVTLGLILLFKPPTSIGLGMALVAACPSGNIANFGVHLAKANVALSVTLNAVIMLLSPILTPFVLWVVASFIPNLASLHQDIRLPLGAMIVLMLKLILLPMLLGLAMQYWLPKLTKSITKPIKRLSLLLFFGVIVAALAGNFDNIVQHLGKIFLIVFLHNAAAMLLGFWAGRAVKLPTNDCRTLAFEAGVHNTGLGLLLIFSFFGGLGGMAVIAAWYGIWDMITMIALASWWSRGKLV